jgi:hypothetical protein
MTLFAIVIETSGNSFYLEFKFSLLDSSVGINRELGGGMNVCHIYIPIIKQVALNKSSLLLKII